MDSDVLYPIKSLHTPAAMVMAPTLVLKMRISAMMRDSTEREVTAMTVPTKRKNVYRS